MTVLPRATAADIARVRENAPADLLALNTWVAGSREPRKDGRSSKKPLNPTTGGNAKPNDPDTWSSFEAATAFAVHDERAFGVGVNLLGQDLIGLDLDHVLDRVTGAIALGARDLLESLSPTYCEVSPSGDGLRLFLRGSLPNARPKSRSDAFGQGTKLEVYDGQGGRYLTVTGRVFGQRHDIANATADDVDLLLALLSPPKAATAASPPAAAPADDAEELERAPFALAVLDPGAPNPEWWRVGAALRHLGDAGLRLWLDWSKQSSKFNEGDCTREWGRMTGSSFASLAAMADDADRSWRDRYDQWKGERLPKVDFSALLKAKRDAGASALGKQPEDDEPDYVAERWRPVRSLLLPPTKVDHLIRLPTRDGDPIPPGAEGDPFVRRGVVASLVGAGGAGKTMALLDMAASVATGEPWLGIFPVVQGRALLVLGEEDDEEAHRRLYHIADVRGWNDRQRRLVEERVVILGMRGRPCGLLREAKRTLTPTKFARNLRQRLEKEAGSEGWALVVLEPLSRTAGVELDVSNTNATSVVQVAESLSEVPGSPTVLLGIHSSKASRKPGERVEVRGPSGLTDGVRVELTLRRDKDAIYLHAGKNNYGPWMPEPGVALESGRHGVLQQRVVCLLSNAAEEDRQRAKLMEAAKALRLSVVRTVREMEGYAPSGRSIVDRTKGKTASLYAAIKEAVAAGELREAGSGYALVASDTGSGSAPPYPPAVREAGSTRPTAVPKATRGSKRKRREAGSKSTQQEGPG